MAVHVDAAPPHEITVEGHVEETRVFGPQIRMETCITTVPGSNQLVVRDEFKNLKDQPVEMQILYHWNFGPPFLEAGSRFLAPIKSVTPRDTTAAEALRRYNVFEGPKPGFSEQVYYFELHGEAAPGGKTMVLLRNRQGDKGVVLRFRTDQLPCFTLWKNTAGLRDGYVTGLEPGTNYPNPRPFEQAQTGSCGWTSTAATRPKPRWWCSTRRTLSMPPSSRLPGCRSREPPRSISVRPSRLRPRRDGILLIGVTLRIGRSGYLIPPPEPAPPGGPAGSHWGLLLQVVVPLQEIVVDRRPSLRAFSGVVVLQELGFILGFGNIALLKHLLRPVDPVLREGDIGIDSGFERP